jgi:hypothetical protein
MSFGTFVGTERERVNADIMTLLRSVKGPVVSGSKRVVNLEAIGRCLFVGGVEGRRGRKHEG